MRPSVYRTQCATPEGNTFQRSPAVDSADRSGVMGRDSVCANYTVCQPGQYPSFQGDATLEDRKSVV